MPGADSSGKEGHLTSKLYEMLATHQGRQSGTWIESNSGLHVDFMNLKPADIRISDIAHGLANTGRFAGQCSKFYSVAEHSVLVSMLLEKTGEDDDVIRSGQMHDSPEAYIGDVVTPLKKLCPGFSIIERNFEVNIAAAFGLSVAFDAAPIKRADFEMFCREKERLLSPWDSRPAAPFGPELEIRCLPPEEAKALFLNRVEELGIGG